MVSNLQEENRRLQKSLGPTSELKSTNTITPTVLARDDSASNSTTPDFQVLQRLRGQIEKHRKDMKTRDAELAEADQTAQGVNTKHFLNNNLFRLPIITIALRSVNSTFCKIIDLSSMWAIDDVLY